MSFKGAQVSRSLWVVSLCEGNKEHEIKCWLGAVAEEGAEPQNSSEFADFLMLFPALTQGHELFVVAKRMRLWICQNMD